MINFKKFLLITASTCLLAGNALALDVQSDKFAVESDLKVQLKGFVHFQAGLRNQDKLIKEEKKVSANKESFAFFTQTALIADISNEVNGVTYGGRIVLTPTAERKASNDYSGSHLYVESNFGRMELGSPVPPSSTIMIDGSINTMATFFDWTNYANAKSAYIKQGSNVNPSFALSNDYFLDGKLVGDEPIRAIAYYTPKFNLAETTKLQVGVSYSPDSTNLGSKSLGHTDKVNIDDIDIDTDIKNITINKNVKDIISGGISLEHGISDGVDIQIAATGEFGKSVGKMTKTMVDTTITPVTSKLSNLRTFNIGAVLNVGSLSYAASYGSLGKSLTTSEFHKTGRKTDYYMGAVAYKQGPFGASIGYYKSNQYKNSVDSISIGTQYQLAPGFKPYAEISGFSLKGRPEFNPELSKKKTRGTVALIGAKLSL